MTDTHSTITVLIVLLLIASGVAMAAKWVPVPYTLALVVVGLAISPMHFLPVIHISPDLILLIFLPALLFEAACLNLPGREQLVAMTFGAVTFSLLVQGLTISPLMTLLKIERTH